VHVKFKAVWDHTKLTPVLKVC